MDPVLTIAIGVAAGILLLVTALVLGRRRRSTSLEPIRLGPAWTPSREDEQDDPAAVDQREQVARVAVDQTGLERDTVDATLAAWWEYLAVLRIGTLPRAHRYRFYDPYDPPVVERDSDGRPLPDPIRVARDVAQRTDVVEIDAVEVLRVAAAEQAGPTRGVRSEDEDDAARDARIAEAIRRAEEADRREAAEREAAERRVTAERAARQTSASDASSGDEHDAGDAGSARSSREAKPLRPVVIRTGPLPDRPTDDELFPGEDD